MKGGRDPLTKLFMLTITGNKMTEKEIQLSPILEYFIANSIYECSSKQNIEVFLHQVCFNPPVLRGLQP